MDAPLETELKYLARDAAALVHLTGTQRLGSVRLGQAAVIDELDRYLDTPDLRLATAGWACRLRTRGAGTLLSLKGPARHRDEEVVHRRPELEGPARESLAGQPADAWPASPARDWLIELAGAEPLVERLALAQRRTERQLQDAAARGVLSLDEVTVLQRDREVGRLRVVELELDLPLDGGARLAAEMEGALSAVPGLEPDPLSKLEHALGMLRDASR